MRIEIKCTECKAPVNPTGIIITPTNIDFSQAKGMECTKCGCRWLSVHVTYGAISVNIHNEVVII